MSMSDRIGKLFGACLVIGALFLLIASARLKPTSPVPSVQPAPCPPDQPCPVPPAPKPAPH